MDYKKIGDNYYVRMDRGDEIICNLLEISRKESIPSAVFSGIGGCQSADYRYSYQRQAALRRSDWRGCWNWYRSMVT